MKIKLASLLLLLSFTSLCYKSCYAGGVLSIDYGFTCDQRPDNATTPAFKTNMNNLLSTLETKAPENYGFYMAAEGKKHDRVYGLVQCRGDVSAKDCTNCIKETVEWTRTNCSNSNDAIIWFNLCFLRHSDTNFLGQVNNSMKVVFSKNTSIPDDSSVETRGRNLMNQLAFDVPNEPFRFKTGSVDVGNERKRYGLVQCNRDLSVLNCQNCTTELIQFYLSVVGNRSSYSSYSYGCRLWYDDTKFYFNYTLPTVAPNDIPIPSDSSMRVGSSFSAAVTVLLALLVSSLAM